MPNENCDMTPDDLELCLSIISVAALHKCRYVETQWFLIRNDSVKFFNLNRMAEFLGWVSTHYLHDADLSKIYTYVFNEDYFGEGLTAARRFVLNSLQSQFTQG